MLHEPRKWKWQGFRWSSCAVAALAVVAIASCSSQEPLTPLKGPVPRTAAVEKSIVTVSAAASTKDVIGSLDNEFSAASGAEVKLNTGPSNALANQILAGAPADLFLSAN